MILYSILSYSSFKNSSIAPVGRKREFGFTKPGGFSIHTFSRVIDKWDLLFDKLKAPVAVTAPPLWFPLRKAINNKLRGAHCMILTQCSCEFSFILLTLHPESEIHYLYVFLKLWCGADKDIHRCQGEGSRPSGVGRVVVLP